MSVCEGVNVFVCLCVVYSCVCVSVCGCVSVCLCVCESVCCLFAGVSVCLCVRVCGWVGECLQLTRALPWPHGCVVHPGAARTANAPLTPATPPPAPEKWYGNATCVSKSLPTTSVLTGHTHTHHVTLQWDIADHVLFEWQSGK